MTYTEFYKIHYKRKDEIGHRDYPVPITKEGLKLLYESYDYWNTLDTGLFSERIEKTLSYCFSLPLFKNETNTFEFVNLKSRALVKKIMLQAHLQFNLNHDINKIIIERLLAFNEEESEGIPIDEIKQNLKKIHQNKISICDLQKLIDDLNNMGHPKLLNETKDKIRDNIKELEDETYKLNQRLLNVSHFYKSHYQEHFDIMTLLNEQCNETVKPYTENENHLNQAKACFRLDESYKNIDNESQKSSNTSIDILENWLKEANNNNHLNF
jgi:hypothetical protein